MPRRITQPPRGIVPVKTSRGTWIALYEVWDGDELVNLIPMHDGDGGPVIQKAERRQIIEVAARAALETELLRLRQENERLRKGDAKGDAKGNPRVSLAG